MPGLYPLILLVILIQTQVLCQFLGVSIETEANNDSNEHLGIAIDPDPINVVDERFISVALDQSLLKDGELEDFPDNSAKWHGFNFTNPRMRTLLRGLSSAYVRFGGTSADATLFSRRPVQAYMVGISPAFRILTPDDIDNLVDLCRATGTRLIFAFNLQLRYGTQWDPSNAVDFLHYVAKKGFGHDIDFELGNEMNRYKYHPTFVTLNASTLAHDFGHLRTLLNHKLGPTVRLVGPDTGFYVPLFYEFIQRVGRHVLSAATFHHYYFGGPTANVSSYLNARQMTEYEVALGKAIARVHALRPGLPVWFGEGAVAYSSGAPHIADRFVAGFLWLSTLGTSAKLGVKLVIRQTFFGGNYAMLDRHLQPTPNYWLNYVYKKLVGRVVFNVTNTERFVEDGVRVYAHCARNRSGALVLYGLNMATVPVVLPLAQPLSNLTALEYMLQALGGDVLARSTLLNGKMLKMTNDTALPDLLSKKKPASASLLLPPRAMGFWLFPNAQLEACI